MFLKEIPLELELFNHLFSDYWTTEIDRTNGEGALFLGKKSKLNQFGDMCNDPKNPKFNVQKEDDLKVRDLII